MKNIIHLKSISESHKFIGLEKSKHPLVTIFRHPPGKLKGLDNIKLTSDLFMISMKHGINGSFKYGRNSYDFEEGTMTFIGPGQIISADGDLEVEDDSQNWTLLFHPDLIRRSELGRNIEEYTYFDYDVNEALHLSERERVTLRDIALTIEDEIDQNIDKHSQKLIVTNIELLFDYCKRYYDRQFYTRTNLNNSTVTKFEDILKKYFKTESQLEYGIPTVKYCADNLNFSANYLSDLLKKETGRNAQDHIHSFIIDKAKTNLLNSTDTVSRIAYDLGFEYPQHFSKLFKIKTGMSPKEYKNMN